MEIVLNKVSYQDCLKDININLSSGVVYGLTGQNSDLLGKIIGGIINNYKGEVVSDTKVKNVVISGYDMNFCTQSVKDEFKFIARLHSVKNHNIKQLATEIFYKLGIDEGLYERMIVSLSRSEKFLIKIALGVIINPNIVVFEHVFDNLDLKSRKKLKEFLNTFKEDKIIVINDSDSNILYDITGYVYILKNSKVVLHGVTDELYIDVEKLIKLKVEIPYLSDIAYKAKKKKNIRLFYRKDVRDTMKDIYRNV